MIKLVYSTALAACLTATPCSAQYLGQLSSNPYAADSTSNVYGRYGSPYGNNINNPYSRYGSPYSNDSVNNPYATNAPRVYSNGNIYGGSTPYGGGSMPYGAGENPYGD